MVLSAKTNRKMNTTILTVNETSRRHSSLVNKIAVEQIMKGRIVAFPTETVYGIGAKIKNVDTFCELQAVKGRPFERPLQMMVPNGKAAMRVVEFNETSFKLSQIFLPGPLTIIMNRYSDGVVPNFMAMLIAKYGETMTADMRFYLTTLVPKYDTIGIRTPENPLMRDLLEMAMDKDPTPIASTSANTTKMGSNRTAQEVLQHLGGKISMILDAGETVGKVASTVIRVTDERNVIIEREGAISTQAIVSAARPARVWKRVHGRFNENIKATNGTEKGTVRVLKRVNSLLILA